MIALAAKTYFGASFKRDENGEIVRDADGAKTFVNAKMSTKGVSKKAKQYEYEHFKSVLDSRNSESAVNQGFREMPKGFGVYTYAQERAGLSYFYCKRKTLADGIRTVPLETIIEYEYD